MEENKPKNKSKKLAIAGVIIMGVIMYVSSTYISGKSFESTDNAQVDGDLLPVRAGVTGYIESIRFKDSQEVKKGDTLIVFNTTELNAALKQAEAELAGAKANVSVSGSRAAASMENARAALLSSGSDDQNILSAKATFDRAVQDFNRSAELLKIKAITQNDYEQAQTQLEVTKAGYLKAQALKKSSVSSSTGLKIQAKAEEKQISAAQILILQKEAEIDVAREKLRYAYITAPFDGIVTKRSVQPGQFITTGQSLCAVINHKQLWITANFKETQLDKIKPGQKVEIKVDAFPNLELKGTIQSFGGATGSRFALIPPDNATGNFIKIAQRFPLRINLDQQQAITNMLYPGLSVFVKVKVN